MSYRRVLPSDKRRGVDSNVHIIGKQTSKKSGSVWFYLHEAVLGLLTEHDDVASLTVVVV